MSNDNDNWGRHWTGYDPVIDALRADLGVDWELWTTGGGCMAWVSKNTEGGVHLMLTDCEDPLSSWTQRTEHDAEYPGMLTGFNVGVYDETDDGNECIVSVAARCAPTRENAVALARRALSMVPPRSEWPGLRPAWVTLTPDLSEIDRIVTPEWTLS